MSRLRSTAVALTVSLALATGFFAGDAAAPVAPKDCGILKAKGKRYTIKADRIRCRTARTYARRYLVYRQRPRGYRCRNYGRETRIKFRCTKGSRVFFAIRR